MTDPGGCPCGSGSSYDGCCGALHAGARRAGTAEQLMRSRYSAFAVGDAAYLLASWHPTTRPPRLDLDPADQWTRLEVVRARGGVLDTEGVVEFRAHAHGRRGPVVLHEVSRFARHERAWTYVGPS